MDPTQDDARSDEPETAAPAEVTRVCRKCSAQTTGGGAFCPQCGASFDRRRRLGTRGKVAIAAMVVLLLAGSATAAIIVKGHDDDVARQHRIAAQRAAQARERARERAAAQRERERAAHAAQVALRRALVKDLERSVTKDATKDVNDGALTGPILRTDCTPVGGGNVDDVAQHTGNFSCIAVTKVSGDGTESGYSFSATVNYDDGSYTWRLGQ